MKKFLSILFSAFYLATAIGVAIDMHYCHGYLVSVSISDNKDGCCCGIQDNSFGCCEDKTFIVIDENDEKLINNSHPEIKLFSTAVENIRTSPKEDLLNTSQGQFLTDWLPPKKQPTWLLNRNFTFYG
jgi:hypothetical protein